MAFCRAPIAVLLSIVLFGAFHCADGQTLDFSTSVVGSTISGSSVSAIAVQSDGKILLGGQFTTVGGKPRNNLARLNRDGSLDLSFDPGTTGWPSNVSAILVQPDQNIVVGGKFVSSGGQTRNSLVRLRPDGRTDNSFYMQASRTISVLSLAQQRDGKLLVGQDYYIQRLNPDGSLDANFDFQTDGAVCCVAVQQDGSVLIGGDFQKVGSQTCARLARIFSDGTLDTNFQARADARVNCLAVEFNGDMLVGGAFSNLCGVLRYGVGKLHADGALDHSFVTTYPGVSYEAGSITLLADGKVMVGGSAFFRRLLQDGQTDTSFKGSAYNAPAVVVQGDGKLVIGNSQSIKRLNPPNGASELLTNDANTVFWQRSGAAPEFQRVEVYCLTNSTDSVFLGAAETMAGGWQLAGLNLPPNATIQAQGFVSGGRYNGSGSIIRSFTGAPLFLHSPEPQTVAPGQPVVFSVETAGAPVLSHQWQKDGVEILRATNSWLTITNAQATNAGLYQVLARNALGSILSAPVSLSVVSQVSVDAFSPAVAGPNLQYSSSVSCLAEQPDGRILLAGYFTNISGVPRNCLARLEPSGEVDLSFDPRLPDAREVGALIRQTDGKIIIGGAFQTVDGQTRPGIARLLSTGRIDLSFAPSLSPAYVVCMAAQPDGKVLVGGDAAIKQGFLARLNPDGSTDTNFSVSCSNRITDVVVQWDGRILVSGYFTNIQGAPRQCIARLNSDGSVDSTFLSPFKATGTDPLRADLASHLLVLPNCKVLLRAYTPNGFYLPTQRLNEDGSVDWPFSPIPDAMPAGLQTDGKVIYSGTVRSVGSSLYLGRVHEDGAPDLTFVNPGGTNPPGATPIATRVLLQAGGKALVTGSFLSVGGQPRTNIARLNNTVQAEQALTRDGSTIRWTRSGTCPEVWNVTFDYSNDGQEWIPLGRGLRAPGGWELSGVDVPQGATVRARGFISGGSNKASWIVESYSAPVIMLDEQPGGLWSGEFILRIAGPQGKDGVLECSSELGDWSPVATNRFGPTQTRVSIPAETPYMFYRLRLLLD